MVSLNWCHSFPFTQSSVMSIDAIDTSLAIHNLGSPHPVAFSPKISSASALVIPFSMRSKFVLVTPGRGGRIERTPNVKAMVTGKDAIRSRRVLVAMFDSLKMKPSAGFIEDGFVRIGPLLYFNALVNELDDRPRSIFCRPTHCLPHLRCTVPPVTSFSKNRFDFRLRHPPLDAVEIGLGDARTRRNDGKDAEGHDNDERQ
jgi:hypothetical protein